MRAAGLFVEYPNGTAKSDEIVTQTCPLCTRVICPRPGFRSLVPRVSPRMLPTGRASGSDAR
jgi:hypothetical protein